jgi:kalirin
VVLLDFSAGGAEELSVRCGQTVELVERSSERSGWCLVRTTDHTPPQEGLVPMTALCLSHSHSADMDGLMPATTAGKGETDGVLGWNAWGRMGSSIRKIISVLL